MTACPCGKPAKVKFCSRSCSGLHGGGLRPPSPRCVRCGRAMIESNLYRDREGKRARCRHCHAVATVAARPARRTRPAPVKQERPQRPAAQAPAPVARTVFGDVAPREPWRPPVPVVQRVERTAPRPAFGLSRRRVA